MSVLSGAILPERGFQTGQEPCHAFRRRLDALKQYKLANLIRNGDINLSKMLQINQKCNNRESNIASHKGMAFNNGSVALHPARVAG